MSAAKPGRRRPIRSARSSTWAALTVAATSASSGASLICVHASESTSGRLSQKALPGLKSVASATSAPASTSARAGGIGRPRKSALAGQQHARDVARGQLRDAFRSRRLEMVDRARAPARSRGRSRPTR